MKCAFEVRIKTIERQVHREPFIWRVPAAARDCFCSNNYFLTLPCTRLSATDCGRRTRHHDH
ncbi:hypothetical protein RR48_09182 [Papilio machaon]|uniref:Uncharacterized protein n=1 Tax=Papilio machaon TaxID=76193 RepID=A0A194RD05_PAPMA|nr:hypothetical protein RR48_09182 [Papilio machaon]